jgi:hypothetical protein
VVGLHVLQSPPPPRFQICKMQIQRETFTQIAENVAEPSTWAMMILGFAGR